jgi:hypothetical protein
MRTELEILTDKLLMLYSVEQANKYGYIEGTFKLQKIPFASQLKMNSDFVKGFNYSFFRYIHGPMSKEIYEDGAALHKAGLITTLQGPIKLTENGKKLFDSIQSLYEENKRVVDYIDSAAQKYAALSFGQLKREIYDLSIEWAGDTWKVGKIPPYIDVLSKLEPLEAKAQFTLDDDWVDSLWGTLHYTEEQSNKLKIVRKAVS